MGRPILSSISKTSPPGPLSYRPPTDRERGTPALAISELWVVAPPLPGDGGAMGEGVGG